MCFPLVWLLLAIELLGWIWIHQNGILHSGGPTASRVTNAASRNIGQPHEHCVVSKEHSQVISSFWRQLWFNHGFGSSKTPIFSSLFSKMSPYLTCLPPQNQSLQTQTKCLVLAITLEGPASPVLSGQWLTRFESPDVISSILKSYTGEMKADQDGDIYIRIICSSNRVEIVLPQPNPSISLPWI